MMIIGISTFRELIRQRLVHIVFFIAVILFAISFLLGSLSISEGQRILFHFGFSAIQISVVGIAIFVGSNLMPREIERQTCLIVLSRPVDRLQFFAGKWLGVAAVNALIVAILTLLLWLMLGTQLSLLTFAKVGCGIYFESLILLALSFWGSLFLRPAISLFMVIGVFILGHWLNDLMYFAEKSKNDIYLLLAKVVHAMMPHLYQMDWKSFYLLEKNLISNTDFFSVTLHTLGWTLLLLALGSWNFRRKDLV